jgi:two-component system, NtrC family, nitrogen regulation sensor histidine kinase NtrY
VSFRRKLLLVFALTVFLSVAAVSWIVASLTRRAFELTDQERTQALVAQFRREFNRQGEDIIRRVDAIAASDAATRMAVAISRGNPDYGAYLSEGKSIADSQRLDYLDFVDGQGRIISSAQSPASFGYKMDWLNSGQPVPKNAFLKKEELPDGFALGLFAARAVTAGETIFVIGGRRLDKEFLSSLDLPAGMRVLLYQNFLPSFSPAFLVASSGTVRNPEKLEPLITYVQQHRSDASALLHWTSDAADDESLHAIPLEGQEHQLVGAVLVGNSRRSYVELKRRIGSVALLVGGSGILLAIILSSWAAGRVTQPVEQLASAAREVAAGKLDTRVQVTSQDELGELAQAFNKMTVELIEQRERLVQTERVAAWRELARRLAHELKNPLFPLQLTVENLLRARQHSPELFDEIFRESTSTLLAEITNLKNIIARFGEFAKMPQPKLQALDLNEVSQGVMRMFQAQLQVPGKPAITCNFELAPGLMSIAADPDLLHRAISNLVLNAMDAMPEGGTLTIRTQNAGESVRLEVSDTGKGLTPEECERLFTPYYTSKQHGTGLGLAIVQSVISDHSGRVAVRSQPGRGSTFTIELPRNLEKLNATAMAESASNSQPR